MENLIYATFSDEKSAAEGFEKLQNLDQLGDITIYTIALIKKNEGDGFSLLHHAGTEIGDMPAKGALAGTLVGALAGPLGMVIGMLTGTAVGSANEDAYGDVARQFLDKAQKQLRPGDLAIVMDVEEDSDTMIDTYLAPYNGIIFRSDIEEEYAENDRAEWDELDKEMQEEKEELKVATDNEKAQIQAKIAKLEAKRAQVKKQIKEKAQERKKEWQRKMQGLEKKIGHAKDNAKDKLKARQEELRKDWNDYNEAVAFAFN